MNLTDYLLDPARRATEQLRVTEDAERRAEEGREWGEACLAGDCPYAKRGCRPWHLRDAYPACRGRHHHGCPGYRREVHLEAGRTVIRTARCQRFLDWHRAQSERERQERGGKPPPRSWGG